MKDSQIECFIAVAEYGGFSIAAEHLFLGQPVVSKQVRLLEDDLGIRLIDRSNKHNVKLTSAGKIMFDCFKNVKGMFAKAAAEAKLAQDAESGTLRVGISDFDTLPQAEQSIRNLRKRYPHATLEIRYQRLPLTEDSLEGDGFDIIITDYNDQNRSPFFSYRRVRMADVCLKMAKQHPLAGKSIFRFEDFSNEIFFLPLNADNPSLPRMQIQKLSELYSTDIKNVLFAPSVDDVNRFLFSHNGVTVAKYTKRLVDDSRFRYIVLNQTQPVGLIWPGQGLSALGKAFCDDFFATLSPEKPEEQLIQPKGNS